MVLTHPLNGRACGVGPEAERGFFGGWLAGVKLAFRCRGYMVLMLCFLCSGLTFQLTSNNLNLYLRHSLDLADQFQFIVSKHTLLSLLYYLPLPSVLSASALCLSSLPLSLLCPFSSRLYVFRMHAAYYSGWHPPCSLPLPPPQLAALCCAVLYNVTDVSVAVLLHMRTDLGRAGLIFPLHPADVSHPPLPSPLASTRPWPEWHGTARHDMI